MINAAAMLGLGNDPAMKELANIKSGIQTLFKIKQKDYAEMQREQKREREFDKRQAQDMERILNAEAKDMERIKSALKTSQGGLMAALLGGTALLGAAGILGGFNLGQFIGDLKDRLVGLFNGGAIPKEPSADDKPASADKPTGTDEDQELGDVSDLQPADPNFKGISAPNTIGITSPLGMRGGRLHAGVDVGGVGGEKLTVSRPSVVVESRVYSGYGNTVIFKDNRGEQLYAHMQSLSKFKKGDTVQPGETIGRLGNTGRSTGPHLHWEYSPRLGEVGTPGRKLKNVSDPTKSAGMNWKTPFTGKQTGGAVGSKKPGSYMGNAHLTKKTLGTKEDKTAKAPYGEQHLIKRMDDFGYKDKNERAMFMGQMAHESGNFKYHTELKPKSYYEGSKILGNTEKGDGKRYLGRGYIQLTGRWNYGHFGKQINKPLEEKPELAAHPENAAKIANVFWQKRVDKKAARKGDVKSATKGINPKLKGLKDRTDKFKKYQAMGVQTGGGIKSSGIVKPTESTPELYKNYDTPFFERQAKRVDNSSIIIVNKIVKPSNMKSPSTVNKDYAGGGSSEVSYTDISQNYYRYVGGIKI